MSHTATSVPSPHSGTGEPQSSRTPPLPVTVKVTGVPAVAGGAQQTWTYGPDAWTSPGGLTDPEPTHDAVGVGGSAGVPGFSSGVGCFPRYWSATATTGMASPPSSVLN